MPGEKVCVLGANGYLGSHVVKQLLAKGYEVNGTVRDADDANANIHLNNLVGAKERFQLFQVVLDPKMSTKALHEAINGCEAVFLIAHPRIASAEDVHAAVFGTLAILRACKKAGVRTVVMTSCMSTALPDPAKSVRTEVDWSDPMKQISKGDSYGASKTLAEIAAWKFTEAEDHSFRFITMLPARMVGLGLTSDSRARNDQLFEDLMDWAERGYPPEDCMSFVDVGDCAAQHIAAMEQPTAKGRYFCSAQAWKWEALEKVIEQGSKHRRSARENTMGQKYNTPQLDTSRQAHLGVKSRDASQIMSELGEYYYAGGGGRVSLGKSLGIGSEEALYVVSDASVTVGQKESLDQVTLWVRGGELLAIMGPPSNGKTTLLEYMTFTLQKGRKAGRQELNGQTFNRASFQKYASYVEQVDCHWAFLNCREIMDYASQLSIVGSRDNRMERVDDIMLNLGLLDCAKRSCWDGLSAGQKKRLSVGVALLKSPMVLFLDEPTSGLDAASTKVVMRVAQKVAKDTNAMIIATLHQPSVETFMTFDKAAFLANGRVAYYFNSDQLVEYCRFIRRPVPELKNPADHFVELIDSEIVGSELVNKLVSAWQSPVEKPSSKQIGAIQRAECGSCAQFLVLLRRHFILSLRNPFLYHGRNVICLLSCSFVAYIFRECRGRSQEYILGRVFLTMWLCYISSTMCVVAVYATDDEYKIVRKEMRNGMTRGLPFALAKWLINIPYMVILSVCSLLLPAYAIYNFNTEYLVHTHIMLAVFLWAWDSCAEAAAFANNRVIAIVVTALYWGTGFLVSGIFNRREQIIWPFRALSYIYPHHYVLAGVTYLEFHKENFDGAVSTPVGRGFQCPNRHDIECFGRDGVEVLTSLASLFTLYEIDEDDATIAPPENLWGRHTLYIFLFGLTFKLLSLKDLLFRDQLSHL